MALVAEIAFLRRKHRAPDEEDDPVPHTQDGDVVVRDEEGDGTEHGRGDDGHGCDCLCENLLICQSLRMARGSRTHELSTEFVIIPVLNPGSIDSDDRRCEDDLEDSNAQVDVVDEGWRAASIANPQGHSDSRC